MDNHKPKQMNQKQLVRIFKDVKKLNSSETRFCFLIGAGASKSSGIPTGWELSREWYNDLKNDLDETELSDWKKESGFEEDRIGEFYSSIYQKRYETSPQLGYDKFKKIMEPIEPGLGYVILSQILANEKHNFVITTNFDYLIEDAVRMYTPTKPFGAGHETLAEFVSSQTERPTIIKIHRDLFLHPLNDKEETEKLKEEWERALKPILKNFNLLVIGYGGNDGSLMDYLKSIESEDRKPIYWCMQNNSPRNSKINNLLTGKDFIVKISDFDELMLSLYNNLEYKIFKNLDDFENHSFVVAAKERISSLNEKHKALLDKFKSQKEEKKVTTEIKDFFTGAMKVMLDAYLEKDINKKGDIYQKGVINYPNSANLIGEYALFLSDIRKNYDKAEQYYQKSIKLDPDHTNNIGNYASFLSDIRKDYDKAEQYYQKSIELEPEDADFIGNYALFLSDIRKNYDKAEHYYQKSIKLDPDNANHIGNYALFLSDIRKDYDKAEHYYQKSIELDPDHANSIGNYAHHRIISKQDFETAEKYIDKAFEMVDQNNLGLLAELWFYRYAHYNKWKEKSEKELDKLVSKGAKSIGWNLQPHIEIAKQNNTSDIKKLEKFAKLITE
ncbi:SIR2 family protein [Phocoenobacter skyensis]|uniref:SIR2 family protein n=1 Tax=Phocoenobacter skyensis TaxID=97481 RepID=A0A1H7Z586_9PAST|nr:SIR2 family protein [Pasteurella skyensis]MDP8080144.1 SIR2 family protein [Pasteurella skyensis]MDP8086164.1 SIR2 family protein [Pasteurella skyensis]MDP8185862.1 SIR2 family protein [Pasteurella skyensis]QLB22929.1 hypothetical protein A6B44_06800 [Pasteurella skyensis]SEM53383.1 Tetratricopeptide repeat-containing protein [Pasteurella skyensis]